MENEKYVTVIPVEYPRPGRLYPHPPHQYHDFIEKDAHEKANSQNLNYHEHSGTVHRIFVPTKHESCSANEFDNSRPDYQGQDSSQNLRVCIYLMNDVVLQMELEDGKNTSASDLVQCIFKLEELQLNECAKDIFALWMSSNLLELQLKPFHKPLLVRSKWMNLLSRFAHASPSRQLRDEPILSFQRNVFYSLNDEQKLTDLGVLELLYEEAKCNILEGRYPCDVSQYTMLGGIQARLELGPYNTQVHSNKYLRSQKNRFLPVYARHDPITSWLRSRMKNSAEVRLLEHYKKIPSNASERVLQRRYLEVCWSFPFYGCAFFQGQIEEPVRGLTSLLLHQDMPILVGINERGIYVIDNNDAKLLLGLKYEEFSWELGKPNKQNYESLSCIFIQFVITENGARVSKLMQIFSKQADMMDALISTFVAQIKEKMCSSPSDELDGFKNSNPSGHCIGQMGSLKFIY
ncbi:hypothetical protein V9T40_014397 [Parthenolecanium corni]|uniref:FERM domain-containing protein 8 n=1 Tax=Parthenolecanium corni TaxID=536013 RepID=A0AAN9T4L2_9HEMI